MFWAMRTGPEPIELSLSAGSLGPTAQAILYPANELAAFDVNHVVSDLTLPGHIKLLTNILTTAQHVPADAKSGIRIPRARANFRVNAGTPEAQHCGEPVSGHHLLETAVDPMLGEISAIYGITPGSVMVIPPRFVLGQQGRNAGRPAIFWLKLRRICLHRSCLY